jgi:hypothetical protein
MKSSSTSFQFAASLGEGASLREAPPKSINHFQTPTYCDQKSRFPPKNQKREAPPQCLAPVRFLRFLLFICLRSVSICVHPRPCLRSRCDAANFRASQSAFVLPLLPLFGKRFPPGSTSKIHNRLPATNLRHPRSPLPSKKSEKGSASAPSSFILRPSSLAATCGPSLDN